MTVRAFVLGSCPHCAALLEDLARRSVPVEVVDLELEPEREEELRLYTRERRVPVLVDHERVSLGFRGATTPLASSRRS